MTSVTLLLVFAAAVTAALVTMVLRLGRRFGSAGEKDLLVLPKPGLTVGMYDPMRRVFAGEDLDFVRTYRRFDSSLEKRFLRQRRRILKEYLRQIHGDFRRLWQLGRWLAPRSQCAEFGAVVVRQFLIFHVLYYILSARCLLYLHTWATRETGQLLAAFLLLRRETLRMASVVRSNAEDWDPATRVAR